MKVLTKELSGPALNWAVAKAKGWKDYPEGCVEAGRFWHTQPERAPFDPVVPKEVWQPAYKWEPVRQLLNWALPAGAFARTGCGPS